MTPEILKRMSNMQAAAKLKADAERNRPLTVGEFHDGIDRIVAAIREREAGDASRPYRPALSLAS